MGIKLQSGNSSTNLANVDLQNNLAVVTVQDFAGLSGGFVQVSTEIDAANVIKERSVLAVECSDDYRVRVGTDQIIFNATFEGPTTPASTIWNTNASITNTSQALGYVIMNGAISTTASAAAYMRTWRLFPVFGTYPIYLDMWVREGAHDTLNAVSEWGFLYLTTNTTVNPIDGIFFRRTSGGELKAVVSTAIQAGVGIDTVELSLDTTNVRSRANKNAPFQPGETNHYIISLHNDIARFWINDVLVGQIKCPSQFSTMHSSSQMPVGFRTLNLNVTSSARQLAIGYVSVATGDQNTNKPWSHVMNGMGQGFYQVAQGGTPGPTVTRTAATTGHPASGTARTAGSWLTTTSPALNNLGGLWTSPAISSLTADADYPVFTYLNPTGSATLPGKTLYITGVRIGESHASAASTGNGIFLSYIVMVEGSNATTSTTDSATSVSNKSIVIGGQGFTATDGIGTTKEGFEMTFFSPLVIPAGRYIQLIVRPFGTLGANSLVVRGSVSFSGYWE